MAFKIEMTVNQALEGCSAVVIGVITRKANPSYHNEEDVNEYPKNVRLAITNDQSSISHSYVFLEEQLGKGLLFVLRYPSGMKLDAKTYFDLYDIIAPAISKEKTMIRPLTFQLVPIDNMPIETSVGFFFP